MMSKTQDEKKVYAHIKCFKCGDIGYFASKCPTKLEKKAQEILKSQGNEKQYMSKEERALTKKIATHAGKWDTWLIHVP